MASQTTVHLAADTVVDYLAGFLQKAAPSIACTVAPYNQVSQTLLSPPKSEVLILWTAADVQFPSFADLLQFGAASCENVLQEVSQFAGLVRSAASSYRAVFLVNWTMPTGRQWPLGIASKPKQGVLDVLRRMNIHAGEQLHDVPNLYMLDLAQLQSQFDGKLYDPRLKAMARMPYSVDFLKYMAANVAPVISSLTEPARKLIVCDLDNTLWGGVIGDDGIEGIKVGANDAIGEAHLLLQRELKTLRNRGVLLAISSKNNEQTALDVFARHPNMVLRETDFVAKRINWADKAENIRSMLEELRLLPSSVVFLDDNPTERDRVQKVFPEILVPDLPPDVASWHVLLNSLHCFETLSLSEEDRSRTATYLQESLRTQSMGEHGNLSDWLASLGLKVAVQPIGSTNIGRATQLLNKTNQFNLRTRRMSDTEFLEWCSSSNRKSLAFSVTDRFGEAGLTGVVTAENSVDGWSIIDFVMSCRVMGKGVEDALLSATLDQLGRTAPVTMVAEPTTKNGPIQDFAARVAGNGSVAPTFACPMHIKLNYVPGV